MAAAKSPEVVARVLELIPTTPVKAIARKLGIAADTVRTIRNRHFPHLARHAANAEWSRREDGAARAEPTEALPGTAAKIEALAARVMEGQPLWHPGDAQGCLPPPELSYIQAFKNGVRLRDNPLDMPVLTIVLEGQWG